MLHIAYEQMKDTFSNILRSEGFFEEQAQLLASLFAENTQDGVSSHGVNRFPQFIKQCRTGVVRKKAEPILKNAFGAVEQWDGGSGPGPLNALFCTDRAMEIANENGIGCVGLRNNTHWMRAGFYGWRAAGKGFPFLCWTNTKPNMPPLYSRRPLVGNNPIVMAVPRSNGPLVLDMALSQFSYGKLEMHQRTNRRMPYSAGYDREGNLTDDPGTILETGRILPVGYWKGSGLAIMLDMLAALLSGGAATHQITDEEPNLSQVFIAFSLERFGGRAYVDRLADELVEHLNSLPEDQREQHIAYPGEGTLKRRAENRNNGIPVDEKTWELIRELE
jgi:3-dehydro-L-gulonate 2-dehydrogenase